MSNDERNDDRPAQQSRRSFLVTLAGVTLGTFALPLVPGLAADATERTLMVPPQSSKNGRVYVWIEQIDDEWETMVWMPETEEEWAELRRFLKAAEQFNFEDPDTHTVSY